MAPNGHTASGKRGARKSRDTEPSSWLDRHGPDEYEAWKEANPETRLPYDDWKQSNQHVSGLSLYYTTLRIFEESDSSDEDVQPVKAKPPPTKTRGQVGRPRKSAVNFNGQPRSDGTATPSKGAKLEDSSPSAKKKRKARKKPLSEEIIASASDSDDAAKDQETSTPGADAATPTAPTIILNGKRKTSTRKPRKKPISEETISPEDELDDPMDLTIDEVAKSAIASPLPVRSAPRSSAAVPPSDSPKKSHILKLSTRKTPKKKEISDENVPEDVSAADASAQATPSTVAKGSQPRITLNTNPTPKSNGETDSAAVSPASTSGPGSTRRGLRTRKPAQQRPYYHDSQLFEDVETRNGDAHDPDNMSSPVTQGRRVSVASISRNIDDALLASLDEEAMALLQEEPESEPTKPKHFKGKGRAWKKEGSDEDEDFSLAAKKKAAKAAKAKAKGQVPKKRGRPRKSGRSEEVVGEDTDEDKENVKRRRSAPRKSALSEEIIQDSSGGEEDKEESSEIMKDDNEEKEEKVEMEVEGQEDVENSEEKETGVEEKTVEKEEAEKNVEEAKTEEEPKEKEVQEEKPHEEAAVEKEEKEERVERSEKIEKEEQEENEENEAKVEKEKVEDPAAPAAPEGLPNRSWTPEGLPSSELLADGGMKDEPAPRTDDEQDVPSPFRKAAA